MSIVFVEMPDEYKNHVHLKDNQQVMVYSPKSGTWVELYYNDGEWEFECGDVKVSLEPDGQVFAHDSKIAEVE